MFIIRKEYRVHHLLKLSFFMFHLLPQSIYHFHPTTPFKKSVILVETPWHLPRFRRFE